MNGKETKNRDKKTKPTRYTIYINSIIVNELIILLIYCIFLFKDLRAPLTLVV